MAFATAIRRRRQLLREEELREENNQTTNLFSFAGFGKSYRNFSMSKRSFNNEKNMNRSSHSSELKKRHSDESLKKPLSQSKTVFDKWNRISKMSIYIREEVENEDGEDDSMEEDSGIRLRTITQGFQLDEEDPRTKKKNIKYDKDETKVDQEELEEVGDDGRDKDDFILAGTKKTESSLKEMPLTGIDQFDDFREKMYNVVTNDRFQTIVIGMILVNSILMGVNTYLPEEGTEEFDTASDREQRAVEAIANIDFIFLILFTVELCMNIFVFLHTTLTDKWLLFDATTIIFSWAFSSFTIMRSFRIFRVFRLFGRIESLKRIVAAVASTSEGLTSIVLVLLILFYVFAVMFTQLYSDCWKDCCYADDRELCIKLLAENIEPSNEINGVNYFGRLDYTFFTLFILMTFDDFYNIILMTEYENEYASYSIVIFMLISGLVMLNLIVAVLCEALNTLNDDSVKVNEGGLPNLEQTKENHKKVIQICEVKLNDRYVNINDISHSQLEAYFLELHEEKEYYKERDDENDAKLEHLTERYDVLEKTIVKFALRIGAASYREERGEDEDNEEQEKSPG